MEREIRKLNLLIRFKIIKPDWFYSIHIINENIYLQGKISPEKAGHFLKCKFRYFLKDNVYLEFNRNNIYIVLT